MIVNLPVDDALRRRLREDFETTFFVEAGAGTGKTTTLVDRIVALVTAGRLRMPELVAITFTEAAAAELRARVREGLEKAATEETLHAAASLEEASIDTIHSFAAALLRTYPLEAGLPPNFDTLDQIEQDLEFKDQFRSWFEKAALLDLPSISIKNALLLGLSPDRIESLARALHEHYDLLSPQSSWPAPAPLPALPTAGQLAARLRGLARYLDDCLETSDRMYERMPELFMTAERLEEADSEGKALNALQLLEAFPTRWGKKANWRGNSLYQLRGEVGECIEEAKAILASRRSEILNGLLKALRDFVLEYAEERRQRGVATFHDLLTWARDLLRDHPGVRARAQARWSRIFIDEFQDTDPLQAEIAFYLAARADLPFPGHWLDAELVPGKLFLVGDPKQSIYRFRRADIALYQKVQQRVGEDVALVQNFRSVPAVIEFVNYHFGQAMHFEPDVQPEYRALVAQPSREGGLWSFGAELAGARQPEVWRREAEDVARSCRVVKDQGWSVRDKATGGLRPADWQDICVLIPSRTNLRRLERAFEAWGVPYRLESGELIVMTQEVRELVSCLRAIDDPSDQVALVATLRSPAFGCSDVELATWRDTGGRFSYELPGEGQVARVRQALDDLHQLHRARHGFSVPALVEKVIDERLLVAQAFGQPRPRETWRRYRYVAKRARDFAATGRATLRSFVEWMEGLEREQYRDSGVAAAEEDDKSVRVLTIHGAKGLEFPVVVMTGWGSSRRGDSAQVLPDRVHGSLEVGFGDWATQGYKRASEREKRADLAETVRLTYVAATRARDHLLLSLWRKEPWSGDPPVQATAFEESLDSGGLGQRVNLELAARPPAPAPVPLAQPTAAEHRDQEAGWWLRRDRLVAELGGLRVTSATALAREADPDQEADDVAILRRGRGGTTFGRAVHAVLQVLPLDSGAGLDQLARAQAAAEGIASRAEAVAEAVRKVSASAPVRAAVAAARFWREVPVGAAEGGMLLEGFIDLLYETPAGLRVVDYKTDDASPAEIERRFQHYRLQGGAYALLLQLATGRPVAGVDFVFSATGEVRSIDGAGLGALVEEVRLRLGQAAAAGDEDDGDATGGEEGEPEGQPVAAAKPGRDDAGDEGEAEPEGDQLQLSWMPGAEQDG